MTIAIHDGLGRRDGAALAVRAGEGSRLVYLDTIRGLAALSVIGSHYVGAYGLPGNAWLWTNSPLHIWFDGAAAVSLFFVLSGFVLAVKYLQPGKDGALPQMHYAGFAAARICRIWLPFLAVLALSAVLQRVMQPGAAGGVLAASPWIAEKWSTTPDLHSLARQAVFATHAHAVSLIPQGWTLKLELMLSLPIPVAVLLARRSVWWLVAATLLATAVLGVSPFALHFMMGVVLAKHHREFARWLEGRAWARWGLLAAGLGLYTFRFTLPQYLGWGLAEDVLSLVTGVGAALLIVVVLATGRARELLSQSWGRHLGLISYSVYLVHFAVLMTVTPRVLALVGQGAGGPGAWVAGLAVTVGVTVGVAMVLYRLVEIPSMALGRGMARGLRRLP